MSPDDWRDRCDDLQAEVSKLQTTVAVQAKDKAADDAMLLARESLKAWMATTNEWRGTLQDLMLRFVSTDVHRALEERISAERKTDTEKTNARFEQAEAKAQTVANTHAEEVGSAKAYSKLWGMAVAAIAVISSVLPWIVKFLTAVSAK